ncbi:MAG: hypothetical protein HY537_02875 [Deltaproteobacteria bacterium]|nr:hypothetical protein [Deltaproteobacteria bacterium]
MLKIRSIHFAVYCTLSNLIPWLSVPVLALPGNGSPWTSCAEALHQLVPQSTAWYESAGWGVDSNTALSLWYFFEDGGRGRFVKITDPTVVDKHLRRRFLVLDKVVHRHDTEDHVSQFVMRFEGNPLIVKHVNRLISSGTIILLDLYDSWSGGMVIPPLHRFNQAVAAEMGDPGLRERPIVIITVMTDRISMVMHQRALNDLSSGLREQLSEELDPLVLDDISFEGEAKTVEAFVIEQRIHLSGLHKLRLLRESFKIPWPEDAVARKKRVDRDWGTNTYQREEHLIAGFEQAHVAPINALLKRLKNRSPDSYRNLKGLLQRLVLSDPSVHDLDLDVLFPEFFLYEH